MKEKKTLLIRMGVGLALALVLIFGIRSFLQSRGRESTDDAFIEAHVMQVSSKISEKVLRVLVEDNQIVKLGDLLIELDPQDTQALLNQAKANLDSAEAKLAEARARLGAEQAGQAQAQADVSETKALSDNAGQELARSKTLRSSGAIAQREYDQMMAGELSTKAALSSKQQKAIAAEAGINVAVAAVASAEAWVEQSRALLDTARFRMDNTKIHAPADGRVTRKNVEAGNFVQPGNALLAIVAPEVWVIANFKETQLNHLRPGQGVDVRVDSYPNLLLKGTVDSIQAGTGSRFSLLPPENATGNYVKVVQRVPVKIQLDLPKDTPLLAPGMSVSPSVIVR
ncbi:MAG: HlyD family secretion protein [Terrimicrobiaceae bacterium]